MPRTPYTYTYPTQPARPATQAKSLFSHKKVGVMHHWRVGRLGGSLYIAKAPPASSNPELRFSVGFTLSMALCAAIQTVMVLI